MPGRADGDAHRSFNVRHKLDDPSPGLVPTFVTVALTISVAPEATVLDDDFEYANLVY
jgi:hypothetical protein